MIPPNVKGLFKPCRFILNVNENLSRIKFNETILVQSETFQEFYVGNISVECLSSNDIIKHFGHQLIII